MKPHVVVRSYLLSCAVILTITALLKFAYITSEVITLAGPDPVMPFMTARRVLLLATLLELIAALSIWLRIDDTLMCLTQLCAITLLFFLYRYGLLLLGAHCQCLGSLSTTLIGSHITNVFTIALLLYLALPAWTYSAYIVCRTAAKRFFTLTRHILICVVCFFAFPETNADDARITRWVYQTEGILEASYPIAKGSHTSYMQTWSFRASISNKQWSIRLTPAYGHFATTLGGIPIVPPTYIELSSDGANLYFYYAVPQEGRSENSNTPRGQAERLAGQMPQSPPATRDLMSLWYLFVPQNGKPSSSSGESTIPAFEPGGRQYVDADVTFSSRPPYLPEAVRTTDKIETLGTNATAIVSLNVEDWTNAPASNLMLPYHAVVRFQQLAFGEEPLAVIHVTTTNATENGVLAPGMPVLIGNTLILDKALTNTQRPLRTALVTNKWPSSAVFTRLSKQRAALSDPKAYSRMVVVRWLIALVFVFSLILCSRNLHKLWKEKSS